MTAQPPSAETASSLKRVLFVDDERKVLDALQRMLYPLRKEWNMEFVSSGEQALERLSQSPFEVLVTDIRMPVMSGIELLTEVADKYPNIIRLVLSGTVDQELTLRSAVLAHQYLIKPCDAETLRSKVDHALTFRVVLEDPGLKELIARLRTLPSMPAMYVKLIEALQSPDVSVREIGAIVEQDIGMTAKVLQLVNSSLLGIRRQISKPAEAIVYLGVDTVRALALSASVFSQFKVGNLPGFSIESLQDHSLKVGAVARQIARSLDWPRAVADDSYIGGLLHDSGKLVLAHNCPDQYKQALLKAQTDSIPIREAERAVFGTTHAEVGGYLLWLWGFPDPITEVAAMHHNLTPGSEESPNATLAVHAADAIVNGRIQEDLDHERVAALDWTEQLPEWQEFCEELQVQH